ncbi:MAG: peptidylprolyl isomerase [Pseudomonadota bacterium]
MAALALLVAGQVPAPAPLPRVALDTTAGRIVIELESGKAPITAANFLRYADQKRLDGVRFYRTVKVADKFGFIQFGVSGEPKRLLPPIAHEPTTQSGLRHRTGTISIARFTPGSAQGDFTISIGDQPSLDANPAAPGDNLGFAAFGRVVEGMDVVLTILDAPIDPAASERGSFKGEIPASPVRVLTARRLTP